MNRTFTNEGAHCYEEMGRWGGEGERDRETGRERARERVGDGEEGRERREGRLRECCSGGERWGEKASGGDGVRDGGRH